MCCVWNRLNSDLYKFTASSYAAINNLANMNVSGLISAALLLIFQAVLPAEKKFMSDILDSLQFVSQWKLEDPSLLV